VALNAYARTVTDRAVVPIARVLVRAGATPNAITSCGLALTFVGCVVVLLVGPPVGACVLAAAVLTDAFDGAVARLRGSASDLGAFYDSVADRFGDAAIFSTVAWLVRDEPVVFVLAMVALCGALITSYIRAKAESLGWDATVGIIERPERLMLVIPAIGLDLLPVVLWVLAIGSVVTILQRLRAVLAQVART